MRINMPVTNNEYFLQDGQSILSTTDLQGKITYINQDFIEVSGFTEDELIGSPHNLVRHPDMPPEAFADMWATLKAGLPWTGMVKNRRKNGDYYWVLANATPMRQNGNVVGYMSVRVKPSRQQVEQASQIYARLRENKHHGLKLHRGEILKTDFISRVRRAMQMTLKTQVAVTTIAILLAMVVVIAATFNGLDISFVVGGALVAMVAMLSLAVSLSNSVIKPLREATDIANALASGDLSHKFSASKTDETGMLLRALNQMNVNIVAMITDIRTNMQRINTGVNEIANGNNDLSARTESQASSLEETASSMEELASTVKQNADNARQANQLVISASSVAARGGEVIGEVRDRMRLISESANKISDIIGVIDGIAFQTNILALNAAVEAARAGEQGRGFAVVASEVRNLAHRSAAAAKEIKGLISDSVERVEAGVEFVDQAGTTMTEIVASVRNVTDIMAEISAASIEQSAGIDQVNHAVNDMDEVTQRNAALVEESAAAADALRQDVLQLERAASVFKLGNGRDTPLERDPRAQAKESAPETPPSKVKADVVSSASAKQRVSVAKVNAKPAAIPNATPSRSGIHKKVVGSDLSSDEWEEF
ncbi:methyl-accepting chemotaxis protein [Methylobacillus flagellatus]|uniref:Methyl-accepting chemotaxis sensory transducer with Pas/Pac sensor n=1 Tax=Methylobacillus flagellatus (strain ATCC 51484 / DSM 6875 / VKM B-1610 / KT) TaxID=265072 RepID=Q1GZY7_METFK|nr:PAS domain-containing methyl-accepting chemotaxis protein [Methylobacillus flagellatus]ABE50200.1 methyl-accepting chemotaxis sensory transducer with Pas/Pac sensor [Methylobacillus flagellatus KT]